MSSLQNGEKCKFCFAVEDSKAEKLSSSGAPGLRWGLCSKPQLLRIRLLFDPHFSAPSAVYALDLLSKSHQDLSLHLLQPVCILLHLFLKWSTTS